MPSLDLPLVLAPKLVMTLPRAGQRKVGSAPVASLALTGASASFSYAVGAACASLALGCWTLAVTCLTGGAAAGKGAIGWAAGAGGGAGPAALLPPGPRRFGAGLG